MEHVEAVAGIAADIYTSPAPGVLAAFGTVFGWAACIVFFTSASKRIGVLYQNFYRVLTATIVLLILHTIIFGTPFPAMTPIAILPIVILAYKEKVSWKAAVGAVIAVAGVALLLHSQGN